MTSPSVSLLTLRAARSARHFVGRALSDWNGCDGRYVAVLLASEMATNATLHARTDFEVRVRVLPDSLRVEVRDWNTRFPTVSEVDAGATTGRGLALVNALAEDWGVEHRDGGKAVWFELAASIELS